MKSTLGIFISIFMAVEMGKSHPITPFSDASEKRRMFSLRSETREDVRIDYNQDKKIDYWKIRNNDLVVEAYYKNKKTYFHIRRFEKSHVNERVVVQEGKLLKVLFSSMRKQKLFSYSSSEIACVKDKVKSLTSTLEDLGKTTVNVKICAEKYLSDECYEVANEQFVEKMSLAIQKVFQLPSNSPFSSNKSLTCFKDPRVKDLFLKKFGSEDGEVEFDKALIGVKSSLIKFSEMQNKKNNPVLTCTQTNEKDPKPPMRSSEKERIQVFVKKGGEKYDSADLEEQLFHENLHLSSVLNEDLAKDITDVCYKNKPRVEVSGEKSEQKGSSRVPAGINNLANANISNAESSAVVVSNIVETPLPPPTNASPVDMNRVAAVESTERVQSISNSQTSGIVRMAEGVLAATPAVAATGTLAKATSTGSSGSRLPASDYSNTPSISKAKNSAAELITKNKSGVLKPGEYIKEEIDLTKQVGTTSTRSAANAGAKAPTVAATDRNAQVASQTQPADEGAEFAGSASGGGSGKSSSAGLSPSSGGGSGARRPQQRGTAATGSASAQPVYANAREEVVSVLSTNSYRDAQRNLQDKNFQKKLRDSNVKVYDFNGNTYGATKGEVVFVDQGDRFVREK